MSELTVKLKSNDYENGEFSQDQLVFSNIDHYEFFSHGVNDKKTWVRFKFKNGKPNGLITTTDNIENMDEVQDNIVIKVEELA